MFEYIIRRLVRINIFEDSYLLREQEVSLRLKSAFESLCIRVERLCIGVVSFEYALKTAVDTLTLVLTKTCSCMRTLMR